MSNQNSLPPKKTWKILLNEGIELIKIVGSGIHVFCYYYLTIKWPLCALET